MKKDFTTSDNISLYVELHGDEDKPLIIWSHGFTGSARNWRSIIRQLPSFSHLIYDLRGHGRSGVPEHNSSYLLSRFAQDISELAAAFAVDRPLFLVGLSFGAMVSFEASKLSLPSMQGLVLSSLPDPAMESSLTGKAIAFSKAILNDGLEAAGDEYVWGPQSGLSERDAGLVKHGFMEHDSLGIAYTLQEAFSTFTSSVDMQYSLQRLQIPTLLLYGQNDAAAKAYSLRVLETLGSAVGVKGIEIEAGGHLLNLTSPVEFRKHIEVFFKTTKED